MSVWRAIRERSACLCFVPVLTSEIRTLFLNLKDKGNPALRNEIVLGQLTADKVVRLTKEVG